MDPLHKKAAKVHEKLARRRAILSYHRKLSLAFTCVRGMAMVGRAGNSADARKQAKTRTQRAIDDLQSWGVAIRFKGFDVAGLETIPLWLMNHQRFGLEAIFAYGIVPQSTRIVLKDELVRLPLIGKGLRALDPIVFHRTAQRRDALKALQAEQSQTLDASPHQPILVFPEGTRSPGGAPLPFHSILYRRPFELIKARGGDTRVAIVTSHTYAALPLGLSPACLIPGATCAWQTPICFRLDVVDIANHPLKSFNTMAEQLVRRNLDEFYGIDLTCIS